MHTFKFEAGQVDNWLAAALRDAKMAYPKGVDYLYSSRGSTVKLSDAALNHVVRYLSDASKFVDEDDELLEIKTALKIFKPFQVGKKR